MRCTLLCLSLLVVHATWAQLVTYEAGNLPIIISVPHGGSNKSGDFPDRLDGCYDDEKEACEFINCVESERDSTKCRARIFKDSYTKDIADDVFDYIVDFYEQRNDTKKPHQVTMNLHRSKLDANREIKEAAQGDLKAIQQYHIYHDYIKQAIAALNGTRSILFDIHGQKLEPNTSQIGVRLSSGDLNNRRLYLGKISIQKLLDEKCCTNVSCSFEYINGSKSFGKYLDKNEDFKVVPSPNFPYPGDIKYYAGGYIVETYGSARGGNIDSLQIEVPREIRFNEFNEAARKQYARELGQAILEFMMAHGYLAP